MDPHELVPLESGLPPRPRLSTVGRQYPWHSRQCHKTPLRLCRLLGLLIVMPSLFILVPLYLRYRVFLGQMYPMSMTDMRLIDSKISPTWCQRQVVRSNATFNAFVVPGPPQLTEDLVPVSMTRELELNDDMKEYWGFYLLKGSSVTVSACVDHPGASLIMIKGYKHLQDCAYIGDDSSEEIDELLEAYSLGLMSNVTLAEKINNLNKVDGKANQPSTMRRQKAGVSFHDPANVAEVTSSSSEGILTIDVNEHDTKELREILEHLHALREAAKIQNSKNFRPPDNIMYLPALHRHRDANVDKEERKWLSFQDIDGNNSEIMEMERIHNMTVTNNVTHLNDTKVNTDKQNISTETNINNDKHYNSSNDNENRDHLEKVNNTLAENNVVENKTEVEEPIETEVNEMEKKDVTELDKQIIEEIVTKTPEILEVPTNFTTPTAVDLEDLEPNSKEVFEDVLKRLQSLGDRGKRVLVKLHQSLGVEYEEAPKDSKIMSVVTSSGEELDKLRRVLVEAIDEEKTRPQRNQKRRESFEEARAKRETMLGQIELQKAFNEDDEARDYAAEEGHPDGIAEHHETLNESTPLDMSNSEYWSSFSSSEEALLECEGLILNLPLTHHSSCKKGASEQACFSAAKANALTYRVPTNGYYFFIFNSENEVQTNYIRARFDMQKTKYDIARSKLRECTNSTTKCDLSLDIFSSQKVVLEVPLRDNDSLWNEQFVIISECEPRTSVYVACVIAVPVLILFFAFQ